MDAQLGHVLNALDKNNLWDRTLVIFVGVHGYHTGERNWWNKNTLFERSCRAPLVIAAPGFPGGQRKGRCFHTRNMAWMKYETVE